MNENFTAKLQKWLLTPDPQKDYAQGALLLLQLNGNRIQYQNLIRNPKAKANYIKGKLQQYLNFRLSKKTHEEVEEMQKQVNIIAKETIKPESEFADFKAGKRADHDSLPEEIQAKYVENLDIVHRMRELHLQLRKISNENVTCPDSERYPFLKELIALDKQLHENWDAYDHYQSPSPSPSSSPAAVPEPAAVPSPAAVPEPSGSGNIPAAKPKSKSKRLRKK